MSTEAPGKCPEPKPLNSSSEKVKEMSEGGLGWPGTGSTDLSGANPSGATHVFKRNVKINQGKGIPKAEKATGKASFYLRNVILLV